MKYTYDLLNHLTVSKFVTRKCIEVNIYQVVNILLAKTNLKVQC